MDYKDKYEKEITLRKQAQEIIDEQLEMIDEMAYAMALLKEEPNKFEQKICGRFGEKLCLAKNTFNTSICQKCIKNSYLKLIKARRASDHVGKIITYNDLKHPVKIFLNGKFYGDTEEFETLIYDFFKLDKYEDLLFDNIRVDEDFYNTTEEEKEFLTNWFNYVLEIDPIAARLIKERRWTELVERLKALPF